jgi:hypothetical protein
MLQIRAIIPDTINIDYPTIAAAIQSALDEESLEVKQAFEGTVASWTEKPQFIVERDGTGYQRLIYTVDQHYEWVNNGTMPHAIFPVNKLALRFAIDGRAKTMPGVLSSGSGSPGSTFVFSRRGVYNPGITARDFDVAIQTEEETRFATRMQTAIDEATK